MALVSVVFIASFLVQASLAPACVKCHHASCVITCRIRAPADAILAAALIASDSLQHSSQHRGGAVIRPSARITQLA